MSDEFDAACHHPDWEFPNPLPGSDEECSHCGAPYRQPGVVLLIGEDERQHAVRWADLDQEEREMVRAICQLRAIEALADAGEMGRRQADNARYRVAHLMGWTEEECHDSGTYSGAVAS